MSATLVIMAAGLGSRYGGIKQMEGVGPNGEILLEYAVYDALRAGFDKIVVILRPDILEDFRERVGDHLEKTVPLAYAIQDYSSLPDFYALPPERVKPFGTVHAVLCARESVSGPFAVLNADDYYGQDAFVKMREALSLLEREGEGCMVAYRLGNTVSDYGSVTRGVCEEKDGYLSSIRETHDIRPVEGVITSENGPLDPHCLVSMNFWGFREDALEDMERYFHRFLRELPPEDIKGECLIPDYVGQRIREGTLNIRVLDTDAVWFGMTYQAERAITAESLQTLHAQEVYPPLLFA